MQLFHIEQAVDNEYTYSTFLKSNVLMLKEGSVYDNLRVYTRTQATLRKTFCEKFQDDSRKLFPTECVILGGGDTQNSWKMTWVIDM